MTRRRTMKSPLTKVSAMKMRKIAFRTAKILKETAWVSYQSSTTLTMMNL